MRLPYGWRQDESARLRGALSRDLGTRSSSPPEARGASVLRALSGCLGDTTVVSPAASMRCWARPAQVERRLSCSRSAIAERAGGGAVGGAVGGTIGAAERLSPGLAWRRFSFAFFPTSPYVRCHFARWQLERISLAFAFAKHESRRRGAPREGERERKKSLGRDA